MEASTLHNPALFQGKALGARMLSLQPDAVLVKLATRGNTNATDVLFQRYRQQIYAFVFHLLGRADAVEDAEDITQETFSRAYAGLSEKKLDASFKNWIYTIARHRVYDHSRRRAARPPAVSLDDDTRENDTLVSPVATVAQAEQRAELAWLVSAVGELPERQRDALVLREMAGLSHGEIAKTLHTSAPGAKQLISRARQNIGAAAEQSGHDSRNLGRELALAAPVLPLTALGWATGGAAAGGAVCATSAAGAGAGGAAATKVVATVLAVAAIGGGGVAIDQGAKIHHHSQAQAAKAAAVAPPLAASAGSVSSDPGAAKTLAAASAEHSRHGDATHRHHGATTRHHGNHHRGSGFGARHEGERRNDGTTRDGRGEDRSGDRERWFGGGEGSRRDGGGDRSRDESRRDGSGGSQGSQDGGGRRSGHHHRDGR